MRKALFAVCCLLVSSFAGAFAGVATKLPEPGPEQRGLRLRLVVSADTPAGKEGYDVQVDLLNVSTNAITLRTGWGYESNKGDIREYLEAAVSIHTEPPIAPWIGQVVADDRQSAQTGYVLKPGEVMSLKWQTTGRHLKNEVTDPMQVQNPEFPTDGLYAVEASIAVPTSDGVVRLLSNRQEVMVGGTRMMPKHTYGKLTAADPDKKTATLGLGSTHKVQVGDVFIIHTGLIGESWKMTIREVRDKESSGTLVYQLESFVSQRPQGHFPRPGKFATLVTPK